MPVSVLEFSGQDADLLPAREALQVGPMDGLAGLFGGALGVGQALNHFPAYHGSFLHGGPRPLPVIR
ncbi:hypothetical protein [Amycolatopsis taiwanensis]|uniref:Uncharacterized protein n=1 Tax=Amycolatopsis taiwanensis TaxID=342230 RepID=A0A9W6R3X6_9PSEU|nr:hypothetical protein [Amycolatopsis taiwanensis]GLY67122.1 hypothetical protein Atai01_37410 [Amycolatopsis taiwanensis]